MPKDKRALVLGGKTGLLGQKLSQVLQERGWEVKAPFRGELDIFSEEAVSSYVQEHSISHIFNTVAYTQVDLAEEEKEQARLLNRNLPKILAQVASKKISISFITAQTLSLMVNIPFPMSQKINPIP